MFSDWSFGRLNLDRYDLSMQDAPISASSEDIVLPAMDQAQDELAPAEPFAPLTAAEGDATQIISSLPQSAESNTGGPGMDALGLVILVLLVGSAMLLFQVMRLRDQLRVSRQLKGAAESEAGQLRVLIAQSEKAAERRARHRVTTLMQRSQQAERERDALEQSNTKLRRLVQVDELTGVANVRELGHALDTELRRAQRATRPVSLIICDLDDFKRFNRQYGHDRGDDLLKRTAHLAQSVFRRGGDLIGRIAGDRFAIVTPDTDYRSALRQADVMRQRIWESAIPFEDAGEDSRVTVSLGVTSLLPDKPVKPYQVFERAILALQLAKQRGGNLVRGDRPHRTASVPATEQPSQPATGGAIIGRFKGRPTGAGGSG